MISADPILDPKLPAGRHGHQAASEYFERLPVESADPRTTGPLAAWQGTETILLVEDEEMVRALVRTVLESCGYHVLEASSTKELDLIRMQHRGAIDLLLTDVVMPERSGTEVSALLRQQYPGLKVLYMSGYTTNAVLQQEIHRSEAGFIQKPFGPLALARKVREILT
jgi:CheY-like chemotaxis protein